MPYGNWKVLCSQCGQVVAGSYNPAYSERPEEITYRVCDNCHDEARAQRPAYATPRKTSSSAGGGSGLGCFALLVVGGVLVFGVGRCAGCDWTKSEAEKHIGGEIAWGTKAQLEAGKRYEFVCPAKGAPGDVIGSGLEPIPVDRTPAT